MAIVIKTDGDIQIIPLAEGALYEMDAFRAIVGGPLEFVDLNPWLVLICNEEGKLQHLPLNKRASMYMVMSGQHDYIAGPAILAFRCEFEPGAEVPPLGSLIEGAMAELMQLPGLDDIVRDEAPDDLPDELPSQLRCPKCNGKLEVKGRPDPHTYLAECTACGARGIVELHRIIIESVEAPPPDTYRWN